MRLLHRYAYERCPSPRRNRTEIVCTERLEETPFYSERERAALGWTEGVTLIAERHAPEDVYERATKQFTPEEMVNLTMAIITINAWNRLSIAFGAVPGSYTPKIEKAITGS